MVYYTVLLVNGMITIYCVPDAIMIIVMDVTHVEDKI